MGATKKRPPTVADDVDTEQIVNDILTGVFNRLSPSQQATLRKLANQSLIDIVEMLRQRFKATKNPLYAWRAYWFSGAMASVPSWVAEYLAGCAGRLRQVKPSKNFERSITEALGLKTRGPKSFLARFEHDMLKIDAVTHFNRLRRQHPKRALSEIYADVADGFSLDERTVARWVKELKKFT